LNIQIKFSTIELLITYFIFFLFLFGGFKKSVYLCIVSARARKANFEKSVKYSLHPTFIFFLLYVWKNYHKNLVV